MIYYLITAILVLLDQVSKWYMSNILPLCEPGRCVSIEILPVFKFTVLHNTGAAFSFLDDAGGWQRWFLMVVSGSVSVGIAIWMVRIRHTQKLMAFALAFILGGALGNLVDRVLQGYVVDFIVVYYHPHYFPAFNIADSAITVGVGLIILDMLLSYKSRAGTSE